MAHVSIQPLARAHDRQRFDCGNNELNLYLRTFALQHQKKGFSRTYVAAKEGDVTIFGYVTVSVAHVAFEHFPAEIAAKLPRHPMPVLHIGRLATDLRFRGNGIGSFLLTYAADLALSAAETVGVYALEVVAKDSEAFAYYLRRGFYPLVAETRRLYAPLATIRAGQQLPLDQAP